jgi:hypothetical protein
MKKPARRPRADRLIRPEKACPPKPSAHPELVEGRRDALLERCESVPQQRHAVQHFSPLRQILHFRTQPFGTTAGSRKEIGFRGARSSSTNLFLGVESTRAVATDGPSRQVFLTRHLTRREIDAAGVYHQYLLPRRNGGCLCYVQGEPCNAGKVGSDAATW